MHVEKNGQLPSTRAQRKHRSTQRGSSPRQDGHEGRSSPAGITVKVIGVLETLTASEHGMTIPEIVAACGLSTPTAHRLTAMLTELGLIERDGARRYKQGKRLLALSMATIMSAARSLPRHRVLADLAAQIGEACYFCVQDGTDSLCIDQGEPLDSRGILVERGLRLPLHACASGKLVLALSASPLRERLLPALALERRTRHTITDAAKLRTALGAIARDGYALDDEEAFEATVAIAVPIVNPLGRQLGALSVAAPKARMQLSDLINLLPRLRAAARMLGDTY